MDRNPALASFTLPMPGGIDSTNAQAKLADQLAAVAELNELIREAPTDQSLPEKLRTWLDDLLDHLREIVKNLPEAQSYAVSVGLPAGIGVTVTFDAHQQSR